MLFTKNNQHIWQFARIGGVNRVTLERGADLINLDQLDQKLWTALSCPVDGLEIDEKTLRFIDTDKDGKIRVPEILQAVQWVITYIKNADELLLRPTSLPLNSIDDSTDFGKALLASAKQILKHLGNEDSQSISVDDTSDLYSIFKDTPFNGDGIITSLSAEDATLKEWISIIIELKGGVLDRSGLIGISRKQIEDMFDEGSKYIDWLNQGKTLKLVSDFGAANAAEIYHLLKVLAPKIDDYFIRCRLALFNPESSVTLNTLNKRVEEINEKNIGECLKEIESFPIAQIVAGSPLTLNSAINPAWDKLLSRLFSLISQQTNSATVLDESQWDILKQDFLHYHNWQDSNPGEGYDAIDPDKLQEFSSTTMRDSLLEIINKDLELEDESDLIGQVDQLVRYYCDIYTLLNNFVTFSDFYSPKMRGIFQAGSLFFDQRSCELCIKVRDLDKHQLMASSSGICLAYFSCWNKTKDKSMLIVAAFTDGDIDNLSVGRNAVFYDNDGLDWDATIVKVIENPISIRQAFWSPYRKVAKLISRQIEKIASSQNEKVDKATGSKIETAGAKTEAELSKSIAPVSGAEEKKAATAAEPAPAKVEDPNPKPAPFDIAKFAGIFAAIGLAFGAIGSALASLIGGFLALPLWKVPIAFSGLILAISGPSMILAWLKLRKRNLAPLLDANGWAINAKATINIPFGSTLTRLAKLPGNSKLNLKDPFTKKRSPLIPISIILFIAIISFVLWYYGFLAKWGISL